MSRYTNYAMKNNVFGTLSAPISSLATTIQLATGQGQRFTADMLATLESIEGNKVTKREIVKITNVTGDTLTVIRKFAPCPSSDDANTQGQVSYSFSADDTISVYITKEHFDKIDGSINDIYDNGTNKLRTELVSGLQIKVNPGTVLVGSAYYDFAGDTITLTDNATNYVEIDEDGNLVSNTTAWGDKNTKIAIVTTSSGVVTSIEDWRLGTVGGKIGAVNIHDLTEKEILNPEDELIVSDSENVRNNKKVKASNVGRSLIFNGVAGEQIIKGDALYYINDIQYKDISNWQAIGDSASNTKIAIRAFGNGQTGNKIKLGLQPTTFNVGNLSIRIETDNNGSPSGNLIDENAIGTVNVDGRPDNLDISQLSTETGTFNVGNYKEQIYISPDGQYLFASHSYSTSQHYIYRRTLTTPWDITTASNSISFSVGTGQSSLYPYGLYISPDGVNMYVSGTNYQGVSPRIVWYKLSTPWDITTASENGTYSGYSSHLSFSSDGTKFFMHSGNSQTTYILSTPWDITTMTASTTANIGVNGILYFYNSTTALVVGNGTCRQFTLQSDWDISTMGTYTYSQSINARYSACFSGDYLFTLSGTTVYQYIAPIFLDKQNKEITLNGDINYTGLIWVVLQTDISNINYRQVGYEVLTDNERNVSIYDGNAWTKSATNFGYIKGGIISDRILKKASASSSDTLPLVPQFAIQNCNIGDRLSYIYGGIVDTTQDLELFNEYYISDTAGELSTTPGTVEYKVGFALDTNILCINP